MSSKQLCIVAVSLTLAAAFTALLLRVSRTPVFRGKPESEWIKQLKYSDDAQVKEWRAYGEEGVEVLIRGLERATHPRERAYRRFSRLLPDSVKRWLPAPKPDSTQSTRQCIVSLLGSLGNDAKSAAPAMIWTARNDEASSVRQGALGYFITSAGDDCLGNRLPANEKKALLPALIRAIQDNGNPGPKVNAAILLKYYPEQRQVVASVLAKVLQDPQPHVRLSAAEALNRVAPEVAKKTGATSILVSLAKDSDDQLASKAIAALGHAGSQPDLAVPVLVKCLQSTNTLIGSETVWALDWAPHEFTAYSETIVPALSIAAQRKDSVGGYAVTALSKWKSKTK